MFVRILSLLAAMKVATSGAAPPVRAEVSSPIRELTGSGKVGFTLLRPEETGIVFTNTLEEWQGASNRVLYNGSGVAAGDFDADGLTDIFFSSLNGRNTLYRNLGGLRFADVTPQSGLRRDQRFYRGAVFADINGDSRLDLLLCVLGGGVECWLNEGQGRFNDATAAARTGSRYGSSTLALADVDGNGSLDLYVANNRTDDIRDRGQVNLRLVQGRMSIPPEWQDRLVLVDGQLQEFGEPDQLLMNDGRGRFTPVSWTGGRFRGEDGLPLRQAPLDWGLAAMFRDVNDDGAPDLYVCNDFWTPDRFWLNDGKGRFRAVPPLTLRTMSASSMGVDFADLDRDGDFDFFVVDMLSRDARLRKRQKPAQSSMPAPIGSVEHRPQIMRNTLFANRGDGTFAEIANYAGLAASDWSWSPIFMDVDLDGYEDVLIAAGHFKDVQDLDALAQIQKRQHSWSGFTNEVERQRAFTRELMEHLRLYPALEMPIIAFRNQGGFRFTEVTPLWGTDQPGVHHALATADFDNDGDLDLVVNNLGSASAIYRNDATAPRLAVRLLGAAPNVQGIGAKVTVRQPGLPPQTQEVLAGGRYLAGSDPLLVFAATNGPLSIEVVWRNGKTTAVTNGTANCYYHLEERAAGAPTPPHRPPQPPLFADLSDMLSHTHQEAPFDDFARQPMLPRRLSQSGPGVSWFDLDDDGRDDLLVGAGRGGQLACFHNSGTGTLQRLTPTPFDSQAADQTTILGLKTRHATALLIGLSDYELGSTNADIRQVDLKTKTSHSLPSLEGSIGPLCLGDVDGDGDLDLFAGARVLPGRYPQAGASRLFHFEDGRFQTNTAAQAALAEAGMVSGAVWSDLSGDGLPELILACEWGPIRIFRNQRGTLSAWNPPVTSKEFPGHQGGRPYPLALEQLTGWWTSVSTGDLDGDGRLDIIAGNWGLNSDYAATLPQPLELYFADLFDRGLNDLIETEWDLPRAQLVARRGLDFLGRHLPSLLDRFASYRAAAEAPVAALLGADSARWRKASATTLASTIFLNRGDHFEQRSLPAEAQWAPVFAINVADFDGDGHEDVFVSQNFFANRPETPRLDGGRGLLLRGEGTGQLTPVSGRDSGITIYGEQRGAAMADFDADGRVDLAVAQNGAATKLFRNEGAKPGLRIRLAGPPGNLAGVGASLRLRVASDTAWGPAREIHAGSGYWSQDSPVVVLSLPQPRGRSPDRSHRREEVEVSVRWPGGRTSTGSAPPDARELTIQAP